MGHSLARHANQAEEYDDGIHGLPHEWWHNKTAKTDEATQEPASAETARDGNDAYEPHEAEEFRESAPPPKPESDG